MSVPATVSAGPPAWAPTTDQVAGFVAVLADAVTGVTAGTGSFTDTTIPTAAQVTAIIAGVTQEVAHLAGDDLAATWQANPDRAGARAAQRVVALGTASQVALSFFPGRGGSGGTDLAAVLEQRYLAALARLLPGVAGADEGAGAGGGSGVDPTPATAVGAFPLPAYNYDVIAW